MKLSRVEHNVARMTLSPTSPGSGPVSPSPTVKPRAISRSLSMEKKSDITAIIKMLIKISAAESSQTRNGKTGPSKGET